LPKQRGFGSACLAPAVQLYIDSFLPQRPSNGWPTASQRLSCVSPTLGQRLGRRSRHEDASMPARALLLRDGPGRSEVHTGTPERPDEEKTTCQHPKPPQRPFWRAFRPMPVAGLEGERESGGPLPFLSALCSTPGPAGPLGASLWRDALRPDTSVTARRAAEGKGGAVWRWDRSRAQPCVAPGFGREHGEHGEDPPLARSEHRGTYTGYPRGMSYPQRKVQILLKFRFMPSQPIDKKHGKGVICD